MATELQEIQQAGAAVLEESAEAYRRGELSDAVTLGFRLVVVSLMMKTEHRPGALKIAKEYADAVGIDFDALEAQVQGRIYQQVQIARLEEGISGSDD